MKQALNLRQQLSTIWDIAIHLEEPHKICRQPAIRPPLVWTYVPYRYQHSLSRCITCQDVCIHWLHAAKCLSPQLEVHLRSFVAMLLLRNKGHSRTIHLRVSQPASTGKEQTWVNCKLITACYQNSESDSCAVWVSYRQTHCHCKN